MHPVYYFAIMRSAIGEKKEQVDMEIENSPKKWVQFILGKNVAQNCVLE